MNTKSFPFSKGFIVFEKHGVIHLNGEQFWSSPQRVQREILPFEKDGDIHFIGLVKETYLNAVPTIEPFASQFAEAGLDSVNWYSDAIVEWDENGQEVWR